MSDFKAKISAELDTSKIEQQIDELNGKKIKLDVDTGDTSKEVQNVNKQIVNTRKSTQSFGDTLKKSLNIVAAASLTSEAFDAIRTAADKACVAIKDFDSAITDLRMATDGTYQEVYNLVKGYNQLGKAMGATTTEVSDSADAWLRQGHSISDTNTLIKDSMILAKVAKLDSADSTKYLTSAMKGYKVAVEDVIGIVDKLTAVDLVSATDAGGLAEAMSKTAVSANYAGVEMEQLLGYLAAVGEVTQDSMSSIGNAFKTFFARYSDIKTGKLELVDEDGTIEVLSDVEQSLKNVGIDMRSTITDFDDFGEALIALDAKWDDLNSVQQSTIAKAFGGTRQKERFLDLMDNFDAATSYMETAVNSAGTAMQKFGAYTDSIEAKTKSLQAAFESLAVNTFSTELFGGIIEATTSLVTFLDKTNLLKSSLAGIAGAGAIKVFTMLASGIANAAVRMNEFNSALSILKSGNIGESQMQKLIQLTSNLSDSQLKAVVSSKALSTEQRIAILTANGMSTAEAQATLATMGLATAEGTATSATFSLSGALRGLWATLKANPLILVASAISIAVAAINAYNQEVQELVDNAREAANAWSETNNSISAQIDRVDELRTALDSGTLSEEEAYNAKAELLDIQKELTDSYGEWADGIDLVNGSLYEQNKILTMMGARNANEFLNENKKAVDLATEAMEKIHSFEIGEMSIADNAKAKQEIEEIVTKYSEYIDIVEDATGNGAQYIRFHGDASDAEKVLNNFMSDVRSSAQSFDDTSLFDSILDSASNGLSRMTEILDEYQDIYKQSQIALITRDQTKYEDSFGRTQTASKWLSEYAAAVQEYNDALASGDTSAIDAAAVKFSELDSEIKAMTGENGEMHRYIELFEEIIAQLNKAAIAQNTFTNALKNGRNIGGIPIQVLANELKNLDLDDIDIKYALGTEGIQEGENEIRGLIQVAQELGLITGDSAEDVQRLIDILIELGYISGGTSDSISELASDIDDSISKVKSDAEEFISGMNSVRDILSQQATGTSLSADVYGSEELKAYTSALEYNNGALQLNREKVNELIEAKAEEQIANIESEKALAQTTYLEKAKEIEKLRKKLKDKNFVEDETAESIQSTIDSLLDENKTLKSQCTQYDLMSASLREATSAYHNWINAQNATESGDMFDDALSAIQEINDTLNNSESDLYQRVNREGYKAAVDFIIPETIDHTDQAAINAYLGTVKSIFETNTDGDFIGLDIAEFCEQAVKQGLMIIDESSGDYRIAAGKTMEDFAQGLIDGYELPMALMQAFFGELGEFVQFDWSDEAQKTLGDLAVEANEAAESLRGLDSSIEINLDVSDIEDDEEKVKALESTIVQMQKLKATPEIDPSSVEHADTIIRYCVAALHELEPPVTLSLDLTKLNTDQATAAQMINDFEMAYRNLDLQIALNNTEGIADAKAEVEKLRGELQQSQNACLVALALDYSSADSLRKDIISLGKTDITTKWNIDDKAFIDLQEESSETLEQNIKVKVDDREFDKFIKRLSSRDFVVRVTMDDSGSSSTKRASSKSTGGSSKPNTRVDFGESMAGGNYKSVSGKTLLGELGEELVVDRHSGRWYTVGANGAEFVHLPKDAIVFDHIQTKDLLKHHFVSSRAHEIAGSAMVSGNAMVGGSIPKDLVNKLSSSGSSGSSNKHDATDDLEVFDWIEIAIERISKAVEKLTDIASSAYKSLKTKLGASADAIALVNEQIAVQQAAYERYMKDAESIALSDEIKGKVQIGSLDIAEYDAETQDLIKEYQDLYEKAKESSDAIDDLHESMADLYRERFDNIQEDYNNQLEELEHLSALYESELSDHKVTDDSAVFSKLRDIEIDKIELLTKELEDLERAFEDAMASGLIEVGSDAWYDMRNEIHGVNEELLDLQENLANLYMEEFEQIQDEFDNLYDTIDHAVTQIENEIELLEAKGYRTSEEYYKALQDLERQRIEMLEQELADLEAALDKAVDSGEIEKGSDEWHEMQSSISDVNEEIQEANIALEEYNQTLRELDWEAFDKQQESISKAIDSNDFQLDLLDGEELVDSNGSLTSAGSQTANLHAQNYNNYLAQADAYAKEIQRIDAELANDPNNELLLERREELLELQRESVLAAKDEQEAINDLQQEVADAQEDMMRKAMEAQIDSLEGQIDSLEKQIDAIEEQIDAAEERAEKAKDTLKDQLDKMKDLIDSYTDALDKEKALYDYRKQIAEQTERIGDIEKILSAYDGDDSEETKAKVQQLKDELKTAKDDLEETEYDKYVSDQKEMLDDVYSRYEENINQRIDSIDEALNRQTDAMNAQIDALNGQIDSINSQIDSINNKMDAIDGSIDSSTVDLGVTLSGDIQSYIDGSTGALGGSISATGDAITGSMDAVNEQITASNEMLEQILQNTASILDESQRATQNAQISQDIVTQGNTVIQDPQTPSKSSTQTPPVQQPSNQPSQESSAKTISVGSLINAGGAKIYEYAGDTSGANQYYSDDPIYIVLKEDSGYLQVRHHRSTSGVTGWFKKSDVKAYKTGGLVDYTGLAWVDGQKGKPEAFLNAEDTENIKILAEALKEKFNKPLTILNSSRYNIEHITPNIRGLDDISAMVSSLREQPYTNITSSAGDTHFHISIDHVQDYDDFVRQLQHDRKFEDMIGRMTADRMMEKGSLRKYQVNW